MFRLPGSVRPLALGVVALALLVGGCSGKGKPTKANFDKVKEGMPSKEVEGLMGPGKEPDQEMKKLVSLVIGGELSPEEEKKLVIKVWDADDEQFVAVFRDDKVFLHKALTREGDRKKTDGDEKKPTTLTRENFDKIKQDMSTKEVEKILGKPAVKGAPGAPKIGGQEADQWIWKEGSTTFTIYFVDGKMAQKTSVGLK
jgi:hypothetical protein